MPRTKPEEFEDLTGDVHFQCSPGIRAAMEELKRKRKRETGEAFSIGSLWREGARDLLKREGVEIVLNGDSPRKPPTRTRKAKAAA